MPPERSEGKGKGKRTKEGGQVANNLRVTFRRDPTNYRPRINKLGSLKDTEQKASGQYFFVDTE